MKLLHIDSSITGEGSASRELSRSGSAYNDATIRPASRPVGCRHWPGPRFFGTHSLRRTKATLIYRHTGNLRAIQLLLGHKKMESTVRYFGIEVDDALAIAEQVDV
jgi:integrase